MPKSIHNKRFEYMSTKDYCAQEKPIVPNHKMFDHEDEPENPIVFRSIVTLAVLGLCVYVYMLWGIK